MASPTPPHRRALPIDTFEATSDGLVPGASVVHAVDESGVVLCDFVGTVIVENDDPSFEHWAAGGAAAKCPACEKLAPSV